jgi:hypothetical protein
VPPVVVNLDPLVAVLDRPAELSRYRQLNDSRPAALEVTAVNEECSPLGDCEQVALLVVTKTVRALAEQQQLSSSASTHRRRCSIAGRSRSGT